MDPSSSALPQSLLADAAWVRRLARALVGDPAAAEDVAQETLVAALELGPTEPAPSRRWLAAVLRNRVRLLHRGRRRRSEREERAARPEALAASDELVVRAESLRRAVALVLALEEPYRSTVLLRYLEELPPAAVAARQGVPVSTVKTRLQRALERLRRAAGEREGDARPAWLVALAAAPAASRTGWVTGGLIVGMKLQHLALAAAALVCLAALGAYTLRALEPGDARPEVVVDAPLGVLAPLSEAASAELPEASERTVLASADASANEPLAAAANASVLAGIVVDRLDRPIAGARVEAWFDPAAGFTVLFHAAPEREAAGRSESDAGGRFALELAPGRPHELEVRAEGFAPVLAPDCAAGQELRIVLDRAARLRGRVVSAEDERPVPGGAVRVFHGDWVVEVPVDEQGAFALDELVPGEVGCLAIPANAAMGRYTSFEVDAGGELEVRLAVPKGLTVSGLVTDARGGSPIAGALVESDRDPSKRARTDASGRYLLEGVEPERPALLLARAPGYGSGQRTVDPARTDEMDFALEAGAVAVGRILDAGGEPVLGAQVLAWAARPALGDEPDHATARSSSDGTFRVESLRRDLDYDLVVRAAGHAVGIFPLESAALADGLAELGGLRLEEPALLAGRVLAPDGTGAFVLMQLNVAPGEPGAGKLAAMRPFWSGEDGRFAIGDLAPGRYVLRAVLASRHSVLEGYELELASGEQRMGVVIQLRAGLSIRGAVFDEDGAPVPNVSVTADREDRDRTVGLYSTAPTDERGWFQLDGLAPGAHLITARRDDPWVSGFSLEPARLASVEPGGPPLEIVLRPLDERVSGAVVDAAGEPVPLAYVWVERGDPRPAHGVVCDASGRFELGVAAGAALELAARRTRHLSEAAGVHSRGDLVVGRHIAPAEQGEARLAGVRPGASDLVLRLAP